jgi:AAA family ATP:ADP antiporter
MRKLFRRLFDIREGEGFTASLMFVILFLLIACLMIIKPIRNSLFLVKFGVEKLPYVFVLVALFSAAVASLYSRYSRRIRLNNLISITILISIASLLVFWFLLNFRFQGNWIFYAFYIWGAIFGVVVTTQFWLLANHIFNAREAKRLFGFIGAGAISGGIFGGYLTTYLAPVLKTENLIFFCIGFLIICLFLIRMVWSQSERSGHGEKFSRRRWINRPESADNPVKLILNSRHLLYLAGIIGVSVVVANLVDYQFSAVASAIITDTDRLTAFFGFWVSTLSIIALIIQLFLTRRILKYLGVTASLFFLPVGLLIGAAAILVKPSLWTAILAKVSDGSLKHSINQAGTELLALPLAQEIKNKAKAFIDVFIKNFAEGLGGILLIAMTAGLGFSLPHISLIIIGLIAVWTFLIIRAKQEYIDSFRVAIDKRAINIEQQSLNLQDASIFKNFLKVLDSENERQILYVLSLLEDIKNDDLIPYLEKLITHPSCEIKSLVLKMALLFENLDLTPVAKDLIDQGDHNLRIEAICYLCRQSHDNVSILKDFLHQEDYRVRSAALICVSREWKKNKDFRKEMDLKMLLEEMFTSLRQNGSDNEKNVFVKIDIAKAIGITRNPEFFPSLRILLEDESLDVLQAAIISAGQINALELVPILMTHLTTKHVRRYARESLGEYGEDIIERLASQLEDSSVDRKKRMAIPKVLALIDSQKSVNICMKNLTHPDLILRYEIIKALNKLRTKFPELKFDKQHLNARILDEIKRYYRILTLLYRQKKSLSRDKAIPGENDRTCVIRARQLLSVALEEKLDNTLERIFRLLGLKYPPKDLFNAYLAVKSDRSELIANSVEFLDNILDSNLKKIFIPVVESASVESLLDKTKELFGFDIPTESESMDLILQGDDNWLKICVLHLMTELQDKGSIDRATKLLDDPDHMVKDAARQCLKKIAPSNPFDD